MAAKGRQLRPRVKCLTGSRARLQYDLSQQPRLLKELSTPAAALLQSALDSHRYALNLRRDDADILLYGLTIFLYAASDSS